MNLMGNKAPVIPWLFEFQKVDGWHEVRDRDKLAKWLKSDGKTLGDPAKLPWCGDAMDTALALALPGEPRPGKLGENPYWALNWSLLGVATEPVYGAIAAFKRTGGGHVGVLVGESADSYRVYGGNQSDKVGLTWVLKSQLRAARWPMSYKNPKIALPRLKRDGSPAGSGDLQ